MKRIAIFLGLCISASAGVFKIGPEIGTIGQPYWSAVYDTVVWEAPSCQIQIPDSATEGYGTNALGQELPAGTYAVWSRIWTYTYPGVVEYRLGDGLGTNSFTSTQSWLPRLTITSSVPFSNVLARFVRDSGAGAGILHRYNWNAFYITTNFQETIPTGSEMDNDDKLFVDYTPAASVETAGLRRGNMVPNSSFECGLVGWTWSAEVGKNATNSTWLKDALSTAEKYEGETSVEINQYKARYKLYSPVIRVRPDRVERPHTLSFYAKGNTNVSLSIQMGHTVPNTTGFSNATTVSVSFTPTATWTRYSITTNWSGIPTPEIWFDMSHVGGSAASIWIDAVQFEEGSVATDYAPLGGIEFSTQPDRNGGVFDLGESVTLPVVTHNPGAETTGTFVTETRNFWNVLEHRATNTWSIPSGKATNSITLPVTKRGPYRAVTWSSARPGWQDEQTFSIVDVGAALLVTNQVVGTHSEYSSSMLESNASWGLSWSRSFGARSFVWSTTEPSSNTFAWDVSDLSLGISSNRAITLANLQFGSSPSWALTSGYPRLDRVYLFTSNVVDRYKGSVKYWEDWNEPQYAWTAAQYAGILTQVANAVKDADPSAFLVALGGNVTASFATNVWNLLDPSVQAKIDALSTHLYPKGERWMDSDTDTRFNDFRTIADSCGVPLWNTESGSWETGLRKGPLLGWLSGGNYYSEHWREQPSLRSVFQATPATLKSALRSVGWGGKFFQYEAYKQFYNWRDLNTEPTLIDYDDAARPLLPALSWLNSVVGSKTALRKVTNASPNIEAYLFGDPALLTVFNIDKTNRLLALTNGAFEVFDMFGNQTQTNSTNLSVSHWPVYLSSATLTTNQLAETFASATASGASDTNAPALSIEESPRFSWAQQGKPYVFRWTALDETLANTDAFPTNVVTRYKLVGRDSDFSDWSAARWFSDSLGAGSYTLEIEARDAFGNVSSLTGDQFTVAGASATANTATVGMLIIGQ